MIEKSKLQEIYDKGATISDMKIIMEDIVEYIKNNNCASMCWEFANLTYVILNEYGFKPTFCLGLYDYSKSIIPCEHVYKCGHAWLKLNNRILDVGITLQTNPLLANTENTATVLPKNPVLFEPCHKLICRPYLLHTTKKFWFTDEGRLATSWILYTMEHYPGTICNFPNGTDFMELLNNYLPHNVTKDYIREKYNRGNAKMQVIYIM